MKYINEVIPTVGQLIARIEWWHALKLPAEAGGYKQTKGRLRDDDGFCCLGVAEDVRKVGFWCNVGDKYNLVSADQYYLAGADLSAGGLKWLGFAGEDVGEDIYIGYGTREGGTLTFSFIDMNDAYGLTFTQIADVIWYFLILPFISSREQPPVPGEQQ